MTARATCILISTLFVLSLASAQQGSRMERAFHRIDRNGDGTVTRNEARGAAWFDRLDRDGDGVITLDEVRGRTRPTAGVAEAGPGAATRFDVAYGEHWAQRLDIHAPADPDRAPVMVYIHGGGWRRGDKRAVGQKAGFFNGNGWLFVSINYRLLPEGEHPANVQDAARALAWVHEHIAEHGGDPGRVFLMGHSAGAHLAALVATDERRLQAAGKDLSVIKGVIPLDTNTYDLSKLMQTRASGFYGRVFGDNPQVWRDASPITHVAADTHIPPFLICYSRGMRAALNPARPEQAEAFAEALRAAGIPAEVVDASDRNHREINAWFGQADDEKVTAAAAGFVDSILGVKSLARKAPPTPAPGSPRRAETAPRSARFSVPPPTSRAAPWRPISDSAKLQPSMSP